MAVTDVINIARQARRKLPQIAPTPRLRASPGPAGPPLRAAARQAPGPAPARLPRGLGGKGRPALTCAPAASAPPARPRTAGGSRPLPRGFITGAGSGGAAAPAAARREGLPRRPPLGSGTEPAGSAGAGHNDAPGSPPTLRR